MGKSKYDPGIMFLVAFWILLGLFTSLPDVFLPYFFVFVMLLLLAILRLIKVYRG